MMKEKLQSSSTGISGWGQDERLFIVPHGPAYSGQVLQCILEEHQCHGLALGVIQGKDLLKHGLNQRVVAEVLVQSHLAFVLTRQHRHGIAEEGETERMIKVHLQIT